MSIDLKLSSKEDKRRFANDCAVLWPCQEDTAAAEAAGVGGADYRYPCPRRWGYFTDGTCRAPASYKGDCEKKRHFLGFTDHMKKNWAKLCDVQWPQMEPGVPSHSEEKRKQEELLSRKRELGMDTYTPGGHCEKIYDLEACPAGWILATSGWCHAPPGYGTGGEGEPEKIDFIVGKTECPSIVKTDGWSGDMKAAFERHCHVSWPCQGEVADTHVVESASPVVALVSAQLLGMLFL